MEVSDEVYEDEQDTFFKVNKVVVMEYSMLINIYFVLQVGRKVTPMNWKLVRIDVSKIGMVDVSDDQNITKKNIFSVILTSQRIFVCWKG